MAVIMWMWSPGWHKQFQPVRRTIRNEVSTLSCRPFATIHGRAENLPFCVFISP